MVSMFQIGGLPRDSAHSMRLTCKALPEVKQFANRNASEIKLWNLKLLLNKNIVVIRLANPLHVPSSPFSIKTTYRWEEVIRVKGLLETSWGSLAELEVLRRTRAAVSARAVK